MSGAKPSVGLFKRRAAFNLNQKIARDRKAIDDVTQDLRTIGLLLDKEKGHSRRDVMV